MDDRFLQPTLTGQTLVVSPLDPSHFDNLYQAASDPLIWAGHPARLRYQLDVFSRWFEDALASKSALVVADKQSGRLLGSSRYYEYDEAKSEICIGYTFLVRDVWGGDTNRELKTLMLDHAFTQVSRVWFHVDVDNVRSQKAMKKIGAHQSHIAEASFYGNSATYVFFRMDRPER
jgi:RimJ/RimL family protein N-acetyltransferase